MMNVSEPRTFSRFRRKLAVGSRRMPAWSAADAANWRFLGCRIESFTTSLIEPFWPPSTLLLRLAGYDVQHIEKPRERR
jgi:hypothetical protein